MKGFKEHETKELIKLAKSSVDNGRGLTNVFNEYAIKNGKAKGSVRNYYYKTINKCRADEKLRLKLGVSKEMFPLFVKTFNESEEVQLLEIILKGIASGKSVRSVILKLSNGNEKLALRYQNKYRNLLKTKRELVLNIASKIKCKNGETVNPYKSDKIKLTLENEIDSLIKNLFISIKKENETLKTQVELLKEENEKLRLIFKKNMADKDFTKEYFNKYIEEFKGVR